MPPDGRNESDGRHDMVSMVIGDAGAPRQAGSGKEAHDERVCVCQVS